MDHEERKPNVTLRFGQPKQSLVMKISLKDLEIVKKESTSNPPGGETFGTKIKKDQSSPKRTGDKAPYPDKFQLIPRDVSLAIGISMSRLLVDTLSQPFYYEKM